MLQKCNENSILFPNDEVMIDEKIAAKPGEMKPEEKVPVVGNPVEKKDHI